MSIFVLCFFLVVLQREPPQWLQVLNELEKDAGPKWVRTEVNMDDHIIVPELDPAATSADPDKALEDYVSSLSTRPMDHSRPLWELHVLGFPTGEAAAAVALRVHHSVGDGVSMLSLFMACTRSAADPGALPSLPPARRAGPVYVVRRPPPLSSPSAAGALDALAALAVWLLSFLVLAWHTAVDVVCFVATAVSLLGDAPTVLKGREGTEFEPRRFVNRTLSLDDIKYVKNAMGCVRARLLRSFHCHCYLTVSLFLFPFFTAHNCLWWFCTFSDCK